MAFENFPSAATQPRPIAPPRVSWMAFLAGVLFFALCAAIGYIIWYKNQSIDVLKEKISEDKPAAVVPVKPAPVNNSQQDTLQKELADITLNYNQLKLLDAQKDSVNKQMDKEISEKKDSITLLLGKVNISGEELSKAKNMMVSLKGNVDNYKVQVEKLSGEKVELIQDKQASDAQRLQVQATYDSAVTIIKQKTDSIDIGSTLSAVNFSIISIDQKSSGKEKQTNVARHVDKLRINFEIAQNRIAPSAIKDLYVCVTDPENIPIAVEALGSGKFDLRDGSEKFYTEKISINYIQGPPNQIISFDWRQNTDFEAGDYKIEVYNNGFKIGDGVVHLK